MNEPLTKKLQALARLAQSRWTQALIGLITSSALAYYIAGSTSLQDVAGAFRDFPVSVALAALLPLAAAAILRALRWRVLLIDSPVRLGSILLVQNTGIGLNNLSPVRMVSEPVQLALITRRYKAPFPEAFATLVGGNALDIFTTAILMAIGVLLAPPLRDGRVSIQLLGAVIMFTVSALVFVAIARGLQTIPLANRFRFFEQVIASLRMLRANPPRLWAAFAATLAHWIALGLAGWIVAASFGLGQSPLAMVTVLVAAAFFTSAVPSAPAGVGTYHFAVATMLTTLGADPAQAFSFAVVMHLMVVLPPIAIAVAMAGRIGLSLLTPAADAVPPPPSPLKPAPSASATDPTET